MKYWERKSARQWSTLTFALPQGKHVLDAFHGAKTNGVWEYWDDAIEVDTEKQYRIFIARSLNLGDDDIKETQVEEEQVIRLRDSVAMEAYFLYGIGLWCAALVSVILWYLKNLSTMLSSVLTKCKNVQ